MALTFGSLDKQYVSTINFLDQREILKSLFDITNEKDSFLDVMNMMGRKKPTATVTYHNFVNTELYNVLTVSGTPSGSGTNASPLLVTVSSGDFAKVREGELILSPNGKVGYIKDATSNVLSVVSVDGQALSLDDTDKFTAFSNAAGEGSSAPVARRYDVQKYYNQVQIFKEAVKVTDIEEANKIEFEVNGKPYYFFKLQDDVLTKFNGDISFALLFSRISATNFTSGSPTIQDYEAGGNKVQTTRGLNQYIEDYGIANSGLDVNTTNYATLVRNFAQARCPREYMIYAGTEQNIAHDNMLNALTSAASFSPNARININGRELDLGIDKFSLYGYTFLKKHLPILDHRNVLNFTGSAGYHKRAFFVPNDRVKVVGGGSEDRMAIRYMEQGSGGNTMYQELLLGALAPQPTSSEQVLEISYKAIMGLEILGAEHFAYWQLS